MRTLSLLFFSLIFSSVFSQNIMEKEVKTDVNEVTVFLNGAQIVRKKSVDLLKGKTILKFVNLSPFIDSKSIQIKAEGDLTVLAVNHQQNYLNEMEKPAELVDLEEQLDDLEEKIKTETTYLSIIQEEIAFMQVNREIGGKNEPLNVTNWQLASEFYGTRLSSLKLKEIDRNKTLNTLNLQKRKLEDQMNTLTSKKEYPTGEIVVSIDAKNSNVYSFELNYLVENAGWFPSYDIRAKNINEPVQLIYKANIKQDTKVDWTNVKLIFSSADPNVSGVAPELQPYYLNYNTLPPVYSLTTNRVRGKVVNRNGEPLSGATVTVEGTTIGTATDVDGNYSITIPNNSVRLQFSFIGYYSQTLPITGAYVNAVLEESKQDLQEVAILQFADEKKTSEALSGKIAGIDADRSNLRIRGMSSLAIPTARIENQTTVEIEVNTPYSILSDNKIYLVDMEHFNLPASFQYYCVPKIDNDAFLIANIVDWEKYNLLAGEANVFFENTYVGKTLLDVRYASDTLEVSLGRDKNVSVLREKIKDFSGKQFFGNKKEDSRHWKITVKNNKNQAIRMMVIDQVPVSTTDEIEVVVHDISTGRQNAITGEVQWVFELSPNEQKEFDLKYSVKYPKNRNLVVE